jgi:hypothetical protein
MGLADSAAKEIVVLTAETFAGKALVGASERGIAEALESVGLMRAAAAVKKGQLGTDELEYLEMETSAVVKGQFGIGHGEVVGKSAGMDFCTAANAYRWRLTNLAEGTIKAGDLYGPIPDPMLVPKKLLASGQYKYDRSFNYLGASTHCLVADLPKTPPQLIAGDLVEIGEPGKSLPGRLISLHQQTEAGPTAVVKCTRSTSGNQSWIRRSLPPSRLSCGGAKRERFIPRL